MEVYYSKKEYNTMKNTLTRKIKELESKNIKLQAKVKELKEDYAVLLKTATETVKD